MDDREDHSREAANSEDDERDRLHADDGDRPGDDPEWAADSDDSAPDDSAFDDPAFDDSVPENPNPDDSDDLVAEPRPPLTPGSVNPEHALLVLLGVLVTLFTLSQLVV